ncbi:MAG TPA: tRNA adenosine(34) deaminase TadA [Porticoccaceae bacterium]|nr:tRNA adenosine(34) deaminase TadA [Gammaproteobacteria bacterium]HIL60015.1 tRNA adenosine(34) deaminase TadA [Porticoccaceae bacterium]
MINHEKWMRKAMQLADYAGEQGEVPVGAILVENGKQIGTGHNQPIESNDPTAHAEIVALRNGSQFKQNYRLPGATLYVTIEPCTMCLGALIHARVELLVFGAREPRAGAIVSNLPLAEITHFNHQLEFVEGVLEQECSELMQNFFQRKRDFPSLLS